MFPESYASELLRVAAGSPCRDQRAAGIVTPWPLGEMVAAATNSLPLQQACPPDCHETCRKRAIHAEMRAIIHCPRDLLRGSDLIHVRLDERGALASGRAPRCVNCAKHILEAGLAGAWLFHENRWRRWTAEKFLEVSISNQKRSQM